METLIPEITPLLNATLSPDQSLVAAATDGLGRLSGLPHFPLSLLVLSTVRGESQGLKIAAGTYLKNLIRRQEGTGLPPDHHKEFRNQLAQSLLQAEAAVLKVLIEAFRVIILNDFVKENSWPELVPELKSVIKSSNLIGDSASSPWNTLNALAVLQTIVRPFQYFLNPKVPKEPVPSQLELIAGEILVPLQTIFHYFTEKALPLRDHLEKDTEQTLLIICKCMYFTVRSYMPLSLSPHLPSFCGDLFRILDMLNLDSAPTEDEQILRLKTAKRSLIFFSALVTRHRKHADKLLPSIVSCAFKIAKQSTNLSKLDSLSERIVSLAFDVISRILETGPGWRLVSPFFSSLLDSAIFPALAMNEKDILEWEDDTDEYIRKNLPSELDEISGWAEDLYTARKSAINLLGLIALSKGPPVVSAASKRKKGDKSKHKQDRFNGELLVIPFLSKFQMPSGRGKSSSRLMQNYYGVLMAYGGLQDFLTERNSEYITALVRDRVLSLYSCSCSPYLVATANWVLGQLASCLPQAMSGDIYSSLVKALTMSDVEDIDCYPVHASAAGSILKLLENEYFPPDWLPLLQVLLGRVDTEEENESSLLFQLLGSVVEAGGEKVASHIPLIISSISGTISKQLPPNPEPWPQVVERGFAALAAMAQSWEDSMPDEDMQPESSDWRSGWASIAKTFSTLLQHAWLQPTDAAVHNTLPPPSCLDDASSLLGCVMRFITTREEVMELKIAELLAVWAELISDWHAWEEMEDLAIFSCITEAVNLHQRCDVNNFLIRRNPSKNSSSSSGSIIENVSAFVTEAIAAYPSATWRACSCAHALLHVPKFSFDMDAVKQLMAVTLTQAAFSRFKAIHDRPVALWKPLLLVISSCYMCYPDTIEQVLQKEEDKGFMIWTSGLAHISMSSFEPGLSSESEIKLAVMTLARVLERVLSTPLVTSNSVFRDCFVSLLEACIHLKEVQEQDDDAEDVVEDASDEEIADDDGTDEDSMDDEYEETEEEFLERYAKEANELENEMVAEGDIEDQEQELELGSLDDFETEKDVLPLIERHQQVLLSGQLLPPSLVQGIRKTFPEYGLFFQVPC